MTDATNAMTLGILGLGKIGLPIGERLSCAFEVAGFDPAIDPDDVPGGIRLANSVAEVARSVDIICLSLPAPDIASAAVREILATEGRSVSLIVDLSTVGERCAGLNAELALNAGVGYVDSPVSGGPAGARTGTLALMVAGAPQHLAAAGPVFDQLSSRVIIVGDRPGLGQVVKLVNNIINSTSIAITCEAVQFGVSRGLQIQQILDVLNSSSGRTQASEVKFPNEVVTGRFRFGSTNLVVLKDMELYREAGLPDGLVGLIAERTIEVWRSFAQDRPGEDTMQIYPYIGAQMGLSAALTAAGGSRTDGGGDPGAG
jgi:3-hydroxyisobutyrate dehydrogenase